MAQTQLDLLINYDNYTNSIELFFQSWKTGLSKCIIQIIKSKSDVRFNLNNITYDINLGIVDIEISKMFRHSLIHTLGEYMFMCGVNKTFFKESNISFLGSTSLLNVLTLKPYLNLPNLSLGSYEIINNQLLSNSEFVGGLGFQYVSALQTLIDNNELDKIPDYFNYSDFNYLNEKLFLTINQNLKSSVDFLIKNNYLSNINNVGDLIKMYQYIIDQNKFLTKNLFEEHIIDYDKWLLKSTLSNMNLNLYIRILKDVGIVYNENLNKPVIHLNVIYTDTETLNKHQIKDFNNFKKFYDILELNENFNKLSYDYVKLQIKKFKPSFSKW